MALRPEHELHHRRRGRNMGLLAVLVAFAALVFGLTIAKIGNGDMMEGFDHQPRTSVLPREETPAPPATDAATTAPATPITGEDQ
ncbi:hypothetical protein PE067_10385 [Paracoccus sp. DMF-8]|uniref:hypothetical protein n=1 Tax=Paracoccus sp. DMF-8 TaxID=3019445 RepID=UPI0023E76E17|nr:hypothetical protein [Paracoccus sp. DMF-8]MDF3606507.1 hypothetical protein [Paracoccus sp. DMF-8]